MADVNRGNRPLSPHLSVYRLPPTAVISILHRITGAGMAVTAVLITWWFIAAATSPGYFAFVDGFLTSWFGRLVMLVSLMGFWLHFFNGIRHLRWDRGRGLGKWESNRSSMRVAVLTIVMTALTIVLL